MSRIGKQPINIPDQAKVDIKDSLIKAQGPKGSLELELHHKLEIKQSENVLEVIPKNLSDKESRCLWGTYQRLITNLLIGVTKGFTRVLEFTGIGWRVEVKNNNLILNIGFSHPVEYKIPENIDIKVEKNSIIIAGIDKQLVGQVAAEIRVLRKPEPYKGKGIKYQGEVIRRKAGKQAKGAGTTNN